MIYNTYYKYNMKLFRVKIYNKYNINVYVDWKLSNVFEYTIINNENPDCIINKKELHNINLQRLLINREVMLKYWDNWVLHSVSCKLKTGFNLVICWNSWSWKSYFYALLSEKWLVEKLYDEDLIGINRNWILFSLAKSNFKGKVNWEYIYEDDKPDFWKVDLFVVMWEKSLDKKHISRDYFMSSVIHDHYKWDDKIYSHYKNIPIFREVDYFCIPPMWNPDRENIIYSVINDICTKEKKYY